MLDDVERGAVLEQPAGEDLVPGQGLRHARAFLHEDLHERADLLRALPGRGLLTCGQLDHHIADHALLA